MRRHQDSPIELRRRRSMRWRWWRTALSYRARCITLRWDGARSLFPDIRRICANGLRCCRFGFWRARTTGWRHWSRWALRAQRGRTCRDG